MNLDAFDTKLTSTKLNELLKEHFEFHLPIHKMSKSQVIKLRESANKKINKFRNSTDFHTSEKSPVYMSLLMLESMLGTWLLEIKEPHLCSKCHKVKLSGKKTICKKCSALKEDVTTNTFNDDDDCTCGEGTRHIYHCARCNKPIDENHLGIDTVDGHTHESCASTQEYEDYMDYPGGGNTEDIIKWLKEKKGMHESAHNEKKICPNCSSSHVSVVGDKKGYAHCEECEYKGLLVKFPKKTVTLDEDTLNELDLNDVGTHVANAVGGAAKIGAAVAHGAGSVVHAGLAGLRGHDLPSNIGRKFPVVQTPSTPTLMPKVNNFQDLMSTINRLSALTPNQKATIKQALDALQQKKNYKRPNTAPAVKPIITPPPVSTAPTTNKNAQDVVSALQNQGFKKNQAIQAVKFALQKNPNLANDFNGLIRASLRKNESKGHMTKNKKIMESINRMLAEGEMETAEASLAAKDLVDRLQDMVQELGKMSNEELPSLVDSIRTSFGVEQANQYSATTGQLLNDLLASIKSGKESLDNATLVLTGEAQPAQTDAVGAAFNQSSAETGDDEGIAGDDLDSDSDFAKSQPKPSLPSKNPAGRDIRPEAKKESYVNDKHIIENKLWAKFNNYAKTPTNKRRK